MINNKSVAVSLVCALHCETADRVALIQNSWNQKCFRLCVFLYFGIFTYTEWDILRVEFIYSSHISYTYGPRTLHAIVLVYLCFDWNLSQEVRCEFSICGIMPELKSFQMVEYFGFLSTFDNVLQASVYRPYILYVECSGLRIELGLNNLLHFSLL